MAEQNKRNLTKMVILSIVTLGIYYLYWIYKVTQLSNKVTTLPQRSPVAQLLLCMLVPFYEIYWNYQTSKRVDVMMSSAGQKSDSGVVTLLLSFFGGSLAASLYLQDKINTALGIRTGEKAEGNVSGALALGVIITLLAFAAGCSIGVFGVRALSSDGIDQMIEAVFDDDYAEFLEEGGLDVPEDAEAVRQTEDGKWALMEGDQVATDFTGVAENENGLWYIVDGYVDFTFSGTLEADDGTIYTIENGKVTGQKVAA
ncbi:MAG: DUF4234 domain-containing protein [Clostridia bacterium]|nr:DUF4234 domain-containing protein [Clostridia bacterium]